MLDQGFGHLARTQQHHFAAQALGQLLGTLQAQARLLVTHGAVIHMHQAPGQMPPLCDPAGMANQTLGMHITVHAHQQPPTQRRGRLPLLAIAFVQLIVDVHGGGLHRQFAQGIEVGLGEKRIDGRTGLLRHIDFAFAQPLQQLTRRQVDQQQLIGFLDDPVGHRFTHLHPGDTAHLVVEAFEVLNVDRGVDVDARCQQLLHVLPALGMTAAGCIAVGQFIDQHQLGLGREQAIEVHFFKLHAAILRAQHGQLGQTVEQHFGFSAAMGFNHPGQQRDPLTQLGVRGLQHGVRLANAGGRAQKHFEPATACAWQVS